MALRDVQEVFVPFHVRMAPIYQRSDQIQHRLEFGVVGVDTPAALTVVSDLYSMPEIKGRESRGGIELPDRLMDSLAIACFGVISGFICDYDGECATWTSQDITRWVRGQFTIDDANQIIRALSLQVTPGLVVENQVVVGDDDVVLASDYQ